MHCHREPWERGEKECVDRSCRGGAETRQANHVPGHLDSRGEPPHPQQISTPLLGSIELPGKHYRMGPANSCQKYRLGLVSYW